MHHRGMINVSQDCIGGIVRSEPDSGNARGARVIAQRGYDMIGKLCDACSEGPPCGMIMHRIWAGFGMANAGVIARRNKKLP